MSSDTLTPEAVLRLAHLARLKLRDDELPKVTADLAKILGYVRALAEVDTEGVEPTAHVQIERLPLRVDEPREGVERGEALSASARHNDEGFVVPQVVEG